MGGIRQALNTCGPLNHTLGTVWQSLTHGSSFAKKRARTKIVNGYLALKFRRMLRSSFLLSPGRLQYL